MVDVRLLRTFVVLAETHSFTQTAKRIGISQSTVSQQIRRLESELGRHLVERDTHLVVLTTEGTELIEAAWRIVSAHNEFEERVARSGRNRLRLGSDLAYAFGGLPAVLDLLSREHSDLDLDLVVAERDDVLTRFRSGLLDVAAVQTVPPARGVLKMRDVPYVWAGRPGFVVRRDQPVPVVAYAEARDGREHVARVFESSHLDWRVSCTATDFTGIIVAVRAGLGIGMFPSSMLPEGVVPVVGEVELPTPGSNVFVLLEGPRSSRGVDDALEAAIAGIVGCF